MDDENGVSCKYESVVTLEQSVKDLHCDNVEYSLP